MTGLFFRVAAAGVLAIVAAASLAGTLLDSPSLADSTGAESSCSGQIGASNVMEEVFAYGTAAVPHFEYERLRAEFREQARELSEQLKASIETELKRLASPKLELASRASRSAVGLPPA